MSASSPTQHTDTLYDSSSTVDEKMTARSKHFGSSTSSSRKKHSLSISPRSKLQRTASEKSKPILLDDGSDGEESDDDYEPTESSAGHSESAENISFVDEKSSDSSDRSDNIKATWISKKGRKISHSPSTDTVQFTAKSNHRKTIQFNGSDDEGFNGSKSKSMSASKAKAKIKISRNNSKKVFPDEVDGASRNGGFDSENTHDSEVERDITRALKYAAKSNKKATSTLHMISWFRVILDEAHLIKDRSTSTAKAIFNIVSLHKWCLTDYLSTVTEVEDVNADGNVIDDDYGMAKKQKKSSNDGKSRKATAKANCPDCGKVLTVDLSSSVDTDGNLEINTHNSSSNSASLWDPSKNRIKSILNRVDLNYFQSSTKLEALMMFVNMLDIIEYRVLRGGIGCVKLVGSMNIDQRDTAIDRTHRIGQHKPIFATRFIIANTIEERILQLQEKKKLVFDGTIGGDSSSIARLTVDDMRFLFQ
ncbi:unnamed protein product [Sphagnum jensenii]|uniref:SNF2 N-terminal domain-containing protein n=1 Tax=Sphagnum jensenii TaxID=128206 RepID=A0ABP0VBN6_9BRYO